jgi:hypothetical protein
MKGMRDTGNFADGRGLLRSSPFRSWQFVNASIAGLGCVVLNVYLLYRHRHGLTTNNIVVVLLPVCILLVGQWTRTLRYCSRIRELYSIASDNDIETGSPMDIALRVAAGGITEVLFWLYLTNLYTLIYVAVLLSRLDGLR